MPNSFVGNHDIEERPFILQAAKETGFKITVSKRAYDSSGRRNRFPHLCAVYCQEPLDRDLGPFWDHLDKILKACDESSRR